MSVCNIGAKVGSLSCGAVSGLTGWPQNYAVMGLIVFLLVRTHGHPKELLERDRGGAWQMRDIHRNGSPNICSSTSLLRLRCCRVPRVLTGGDHKPLNMNRNF